MKTFSLAVLTAILALAVMPSASAQGFSAVTLDASAVSSHGACLVGQIVPKPGASVAGATPYTQFVYNPDSPPTPSNGVGAPYVSQYAPSDGTGPVVMDVVSCIGPILPTTTYYFKLTGSTNFYVAGNVVTFTTLDEGAPFIDPGYGTKPIPGSGNLKGCAGCQVAVVGENFGPLTQVYFNDTPIDPSLVYVTFDRLLTFQLPDRLPVGSVWTVRVVNNGLRSNSVPLVVIPASVANATPNPPNTR